MLESFCGSKEKLLEQQVFLLLALLYDIDSVCLTRIFHEHCVQFMELPDNHELKMSVNRGYSGSPVKALNITVTE